MKLVNPHQLELFAAEEIERTRPERTNAKTAPAEKWRIPVEIGGEVRIMTPDALDRAERELGPCENEDGTSLFYVLRDIARHNPKRIILI